ncbi:MAG TPA: glycosyltransferase [Afifellaceae bacterium]|nr:glycosyltransferase [Afifellaceae bacterium]
MDKVVVRQIENAADEAEQAKLYWAQPKTQPLTYDTPAHYVRALFELAKALQSKAIFEFGCGSGRNLAAIKALLDAANLGGVTFKGVDVNPSSVEWGREHFNLDLIVGDEQALEQFGDGEFDLVFTVSVLDHIPQPEAAITALMRLTRGYAVFVEPSPEASARDNQLADGKVELIRTEWSVNSGDAATPYTFLHNYDELFASLGLEILCQAPMPTHLNKVGPFYTCYVVGKAGHGRGGRKPSTRIEAVVPHLLRQSMLQLLSNEHEFRRRAAQALRDRKAADRKSEQLAERSAKELLEERKTREQAQRQLANAEAQLREEIKAREEAASDAAKAEQRRREAEQRRREALKQERALCDEVKRLTTSLDMADTARRLAQSQAEAFHDEVERLSARLAETETAVNEALPQAGSLRQELERQSAARAEAEQALAEAQRQAASLGGELARQSAARAEAEQALGEAQRQAASLSGELERQSVARAEAEQAQDEAQRQAASLSNELARQSAVRAEAEQALGDAQRQAASLSGELERQSAVRAEAEQALGEAQRQVAGLSEELARQAAALDEAHKRRNFALQQVRSLRQEVKRLSASLKQETKSRRDLKRQMNETRAKFHNDLAYRLGRALLQAGKHPLSWPALPLTIYRAYRDHRNANLRKERTSDSDDPQSRKGLESVPQHAAALDAASREGEDDSQEAVTARLTALVRAGNFDEALRLARQAAEQFPAESAVQSVSRQCQLMAARARLKLREDAAALEILDQITAPDRDSRRQVAELRMEILLKQGDIQGLYRYAQEAGAQGQAITNLVQRREVGRVELLDWAERVGPRPREDRGIRTRGILYLLHNCLPFANGGYAMRAHGLLRGFQNACWDVTAVARLGYPHDRKVSNDEQVVEIDGVSYHFLSPEMSSDQRDQVAYTERYAEMVLDRVDRSRIGAVQGASFFYNGLAGRLIADALDVPLVYEMRGLEWFARGAIDPAWNATEHAHMLAQLELTSARWADHVFAITGALRSWLVENGVEADRISVLPNGCSVADCVAVERDSELEEELGLAGAFVVGYIGSVVHYEGIEDIVAAVKKSRSLTDQNIKFLLVGDGQHFKPVMREVKRLSAEAFVVAPGRVPHDQVKRYYSLIDVFVMARRDLPICHVISPLKPVEAMAMGKPLITSDVAAIKEMTDAANSGLTFPAGDVDALAERILEAAAMGEPLQEMAARGRRWATVERDWSALAAVALQDLERAFGRNPAQSETRRSARNKRSPARQSR